MSQPTDDAMKPLLEIMSALRDKHTGCPWDIEQNFSTIAPYTIEEAYEVCEAIRLNDMDALKEELGDLLLQVVFHAQMADEQGAFNFADIVQSICEKMVRRHPHVFGDNTSIHSAEAQTENWETIKAAEREEKSNSSAESHSTLDDVPHTLPALMRAQKIGKRAARTGFDWPDIQGVVEKVEEELDEVLHAASSGDEGAIIEEMGDLLFAVTNLARHLNTDSEAALRQANHKFVNRFQFMEQLIQQDKKDLAAMDIDALEQYWTKAKEKERKI